MDDRNGSLKKIFCRFISRRLREALLGGAWPGKARPGVGLPMALVVILIGTALIAFVFQASSSFMRISTRQQATYMDHTWAASYIEMAKGMITEYNIQQGLLVPGTPGRVALQCQRREDSTYEAFRVNNLADLRIPEVPTIPPAPGVPGMTGGTLSMDVFSPDNSKRLTLQVYDIAYSYANLEATAGQAVTLMGDRDFPVPILLLDITGSDSSRRGQRRSHTPFTGDVYLPDYEATRTEINMNQVGVYLVRVRLFDLCAVIIQK